MIAQLSPARFNVWRDASGTAPVVLDVREPWELQTASVTPEGFVLLHVPMQSLPARLTELKTTYAEDQPIVCLCHHGIRSQQVANYLVRNGFTNVVNLDGGIAAWALELDPRIAQY